MYNKVVFLLFLFNGCVICANSVASSWIYFTEALKDSMGKCPVNLDMFDCLKHSSRNVFDKMITLDVVPLTLGVRLIRDQRGQKKSFNLNATATEQIRHHNFADRSDTALTRESWSEHILENFVNLFRTHSLDIDFMQRSVSARGRHRHRNQMLPMMILGVTALGVFTIPMGFQFLSVLGGKALLLAKMALMLAMMNGLKKVATSGVHYGLYHTDHHQHHGYNYLDRGDVNRPRFTEM